MHWYYSLIFIRLSVVPVSETRPLIDTLKQELRKQRVTYRQVADALELSETSVKRLFADESFSLKRLEKVCEMLHLGISDLVRLMQNRVELTAELTLEQEQELVADVRLLLVALLLLNKLQFTDIITTYEISETEGIRLLTRLDRMKLIELQPGNRVRLMVSSNFAWIPGGPIQRFFESRVQQEFLNSSFNRPGESRIFTSGMISQSANAEIIRKMQQLARELTEMTRESENLPLEQRYGTSLMMAIRPWEIEVFRELRRATDERQFGQ
jgi:DNA-binding Xre family transcriptional regulator